MNNKEMYLKFIKDFNSINVFDILRELNLITSGFYTYRYSLEKMQLVTDEMRKKIKGIYPVIEDKKFVLSTKEKNINFVKDITNISTNNIINDLKIDKASLYTYRISELKYELVVNEIKKQLDKVYKKYSQIR